MSSTTKLHTAADLWRMSGDEPWELWEGVLRQVPGAGGEASNVAGWILVLISLYVRPRDLRSVANVWRRAVGVVGRSVAPSAGSGRGSEQRRWMDPGPDLSVRPPTGSKICGECLATSRGSCGKECCAKCREREGKRATSLDGSWS